MSQRRYYIRIQYRKVGYDFRHSKILVWPKLFPTRLMAEWWLTHVFRFRGIPSSPGYRKLSASVESCTIRTETPS